MSSSSNISSNKKSPLPSFLRNTDASGKTVVDGSCFCTEKTQTKDTSVFTWPTKCVQKSSVLVNYFQTFLLN